MTAVAASPLRRPVPLAERRCIDCGRRCKILRCERCLAREQRIAEGRREYYAKNKARAHFPRPLGAVPHHHTHGE